MGLRTMLKRLGAKVKSSPRNDTQPEPVDNPFDDSHAEACGRQSDDSHAEACGRQSDDSHAEACVRQSDDSHAEACVRQSDDSSVSAVWSTVSTVRNIGDPILRPIITQEANTTKLAIYRQDYSELSGGHNEDEKVFKNPAFVEAYLEEKRTEVRDRTKAAIMDTFEDSRSCEVDLFLETQTYFLLPMKIVDARFVHPDNPLGFTPSTRIDGSTDGTETAAELYADEEFLPGSEIHVYYGSMLKSVSDYIESVVKKLWNPDVLVKVQILLLVQASVTVEEFTEVDVEVGRVRGSQHASATGNASGSGGGVQGAGAASSPEPVRPLVFNCRDLTKENVAQFTFRVEGFATEREARRILGARIKVFDRKSQRAFSYCLQPKGVYACPHGVTDAMHWSHAAGDTACPCPSSATVFAVRQKPMGSPIGTIAEFLEAYEKLQG